ncbi:hypothetical protein DTO96_101141 [Ephemeroptericola cinctiostellae]|uniref:YgjP-like metallopeptidase domain-containing protein n=1 Tax=Ephemeroptericola cinctiostellae TaxID=2268024 RepID=A0A345DAM2_9BURK|nr:SprT family zinc-dependent metalloprotease [Ephemeroptericola cinctiostellae]AXF85410.1 hypothetical protein DTO96_101141 [Ephemeroptericola cinctiostellae]
MSRLREWLNQLQLSLFGDNDVPASSAKPISEKKAPTRGRLKSVDQMMSTPMPSLEPIEAPVPPARRARTVLLGAHEVPYTIERVRRRTVGMLVDHSGLRVRASSAVTVLEIERILQLRADWILKSLNKMQNAVPRVSFVPNLVVADGDVLPILGRAVRIFWRTGAAKMDAQVWLAQQWGGAAEAVLILRDVAPARREKAVRDALTAILLAYLFQRAQRYAVAHGLRYRLIVLSSAKTLWGTCRSDGTVRLNWRLVFLDVALVDYVLAHELSHTVHMNHSRLFWEKVAELCPDYKHCVRELKQYNLRAT